MPTNFDLEALGLTRDLYARMQSVSNFRRCEIWIRATNPGVIEGFSMGKNVTGKTLFTKVKSSNYPPIKANLAFFAPLSKPKDTPPPPASNEGKDFWESQIKDQKALLEVVLGETPKPYANQAYPSQVFIPKVLPAQLLIGRLRLQELGGLAAGGAPPAWIRIVSGYGTSGYCQYVSVPGLADPILIQEDGSQLDTQPPLINEVEFLWIRQPGLDDITTSFQDQMKTLVLGANPNAAPSAPDFKAKLVPHAKYQQGVYYQLFVKRATVPAPSREPMHTQWDQLWQSDQARKAQQWFAPPLPDSAECPVGAHASDYQALSVLGQLKIPLLEQDRLANQTLFYYEIVADYDLFCIAPQIEEVSSTLAGRASGSRPGEAQHQPDYYFPKFISGQGLISRFEDAVGKDLNGQLRLDSGIADDPSHPAYLRYLEENPAEFILHGCEVNNYFYPEAFGTLLCIRPHTNAPLITSARAFVEKKEEWKTYLRQWNMQWGRCATGTWSNGEWKKRDPVLADLLGAPSVAESGALKTSIALINRFALEIIDWRDLQQILPDLAGWLATYDRGVRLWFYVGWYHTLYRELEKAYTDLCSHATKADQDVYESQLNEARSYISLLLYRLKQENHALLQLINDQASNGYPFPPAVTIVNSELTTWLDSASQWYSKYWKTGSASSATSSPQPNENSDTYLDDTSSPVQFIGGRQIRFASSSASQSPDPRQPARRTRIVPPQ